MKERIFIIFITFIVSYAQLSTKLVTPKEKLCTIVHNSTQVEEKKEEEQKTELKEKKDETIKPIEKKQENKVIKETKKEIQENKKVEVIKPTEPKKEVQKEKQAQENHKVEAVAVKQNYPQLATFLIEMINQERQSPVYQDATLLQSSHIRANEAYTKWSHTRPNGTHWDTTLSSLINIQTVPHGENLAQIQVDYQDYYTDEELKNIASLLHIGLVNSPTHYAVMTNENYKKVNVGIYTYQKDTTLMITIAQHYIN